MQRTLSSLAFVVLFHLSLAVDGVQMSASSSWNVLKLFEADPTPMDHGALREELQQELGGKSFYYIPNPGNGGDYVIQYGQLLLFADMGLTYQTGDPNRRYTNSLLVYSGNGNMVQVDHTTYKDLANFLNANSDPSLGNKIIILPSTIAGWDSLLAGLSSNVVIYCRDPPSYQHVTETVSSDIKVVLTHDMAFYVGDLDPDLPSIRKIAQSPPKGVGYLLRTDSESRTPGRRPSGNRDISQEASQHNHGDHASFEFVKQVAHYVLNAVAQYQEVWTDRLHLCISAALVGVQKAHCMDNNYGKVKAIYDLSIQGKFSNTEFAGNPDSMPWAALIDGRATIMRRTSHKAQQPHDSRISHKAHHAHGSSALEIKGSGVAVSKAEIEATSLVQSERNIDANLAATRRLQSASGVSLGDNSTEIKAVQ